jgi:starch synthase
LKNRSNRLVGIVNGIDTDMWNPATDPLIPANYTVETLNQKSENKKALCERVGFNYDERVMLIGTISRIVHQKGFQILIPVLTDVLNMPVQMVILGSGDPYYEHVFRETARAFPDRFSVTIGYDEELSHLIEAGADTFLMPSLYEPCGLNQMMSMRYGTLPIVRSTGGLADTVKDADHDLLQGTGFTFTNYNPNELLKTINRAGHAFRDCDKWQTIQRNAMCTDFSWNRSAELYLDLYRFCMDNPPWTPQ